MKVKLKSHFKIAEKIKTTNRNQSNKDDKKNTNDFKESDHPHNDIRHAILSESCSTWELGCGHGLPGCLILRELFKR